ncbi:MobC family plasmid mobilization relaxosome protein, partial [Brevundimonas sp.]|uniref:MobC family plasmid mobilization relaxosome protein n=1 Tax=Brevundimonas sp. TaxID=1871086 RepID=UPI0028A1B2F0
TGRLALRLDPADLAALEAEAASRGHSRTQWAVSLIRARLYRRPQFTRSEAMTIVEVQRELRRIGVNINQIARALNTAVMDGTVLELEVAQLDAFSHEIRAHLTGIRDAIRGDLAYWSIEP